MLEVPKSYLKLWPLSSVDQSNRLLICRSCVRVAEGSQRKYSLKYMGELHTVLYKSDIVLTDTVLNQVSRQVPDCNKFPPTIYLAGRV